MRRYTTVSKRLLEILYKQFKFVDHLHAIRRYLLLGQGDFIRHLMDVLHKDLAGPASALYVNNLQRKYGRVFSAGCQNLLLTIARVVALFATPWDSPLPRLVPTGTSTT